MGTILAFVSIDPRARLSRMDHCGRDSDRRRFRSITVWDELVGHGRGGGLLLGRSS